MKKSEQAKCIHICEYNLEPCVWDETGKPELHDYNRLLYQLYKFKIFWIIKNNHSWKLFIWLIMKRIKRVKAKKAEATNIWMR